MIGKAEYPPIRIVRIEAFAFRSPVVKPVHTSFGTMRDRPAVFVKIEDGDGAFGWGEIFANWPAAGAEHRVNLLEKDIGSLVLGLPLQQPQDLYDYLTKHTHIRALQCGEWGPFRHVIAGLDTACWDLFARREGLPVRKLLNPKAADHVSAYASGIHVRDSRNTAQEIQKAGFNAFKVKVGFDMKEDLSAISALADDFNGKMTLYADANQAWDVDAAKYFLANTDHIGLGWLEEPIPADRPATEWLELAQATDVPLAGGENIAGEQEFDDALALSALRVYQPDIAKWGGFTGCMGVARKVIRAGHLYCPHFLGGGIGLLASAELLAAAGGAGRLEVDVNQNPLRDRFVLPGEHITQGTWACARAPGLGFECLPEAISNLETHSATIML